jgi:hypothetical protein
VSLLPDSRPPTAVLFALPTNILPGVSASIFSIVLDEFLELFRLTLLDFGVDWEIFDLVI